MEMRKLQIASEESTVGGSDKDGIKNELIQENETFRVKITELKKELMVS